MARSPARSAHAHDLLDAFGHDVTVDRYADWDELMRLLPRIRRCRSGASCSTSMARIARALARLRRAVRGAPGDQPSSGLRQGLPRARPRLHPGRRAAATPRRARLARTRDARRCAPRSSRLRTGRAGCSSERAGFARRDPRSAARRRSRRDPALAEDLASRLAHRDPLAERVHHRRGERRWLAARAALLGCCVRWHGETRRPPPPRCGSKVSGSSSSTPACACCRRREREAMYAIYGFCRLVDDIADDRQGARADRAAALDAWRARYRRALRRRRSPGRRRFLRRGGASASRSSAPISRR